MEGEALASGRKEILPKSVLQAIPTYAMSLFLLPKGLCDELMQISRVFWWGKGGDKKGLAWKKWDQMCRTKEERGLGFRDTETFNFTLLAKQGWILIQFPDSLVARVLKTRYFPNSSFFGGKEGILSFLYLEFYL